MSTTPSTTLAGWIARDAITVPFDPPSAFDAAIDRMVAALGGDAIDLLGFGEPLHGGEEFLVSRNRIFERLVAAHGYTAIAFESSYPRGLATDDFANGRGSATSYDAIVETGWSHTFGKLDANRELIEWMRTTNASAADARKLRFYGVDAPTEMMYADSPRHLLELVLTYLDESDSSLAAAHRAAIEPLLGDDAAWTNQAAAMDPSQSIGGTKTAMSLRIAVKRLATDLQSRRDALVAAGGDERFNAAVHQAASAQQLLSYHAAMARQSPDRVAELLGMRDAMMADNLVYAVAAEKARGGKVMVFAHNSHLKRGLARWDWGTQRLEWWPAGEHVKHMLGGRYAVIGGGVGTSPDNGIAAPEPETIEARLLATQGPTRFITTHAAAAIAGIDTLPQRSGGANPSYFAIVPKRLSDFDGLFVVESVTFNRGGMRPS